MRNRLIQIVTLVGCSFVANAALGQSAASQSVAPDLPLGLERLHWGGPVSDAQALFPDLRISAESGLSVEPGDNPVMASVLYQFGDCQFLVGLSFYRDKLDKAFLRSPKGESTELCRTDVAHDLNAHFASGNTPVPADNREYVARVLRDNRTYVRYFSSPGQRLEMSFDPVEDVSGRRAAMGRYARCQDIQVTVNATADSTTTTLPQVLPDRDLGCAYPALSYKLNETGTVELTVCIGSDGSVSSVRMAEANKSPRLNDAAVRIATNRLQFLPELQDGGSRAVASCPLITVKFAIIHPIIPVQR